jgi:hypothetical protein
MKQADDHVSVVFAWASICEQLQLYYRELATKPGFLPTKTHNVRHIKICILIQFPTKKKYSFNMLKSQLF